MKTVSYFEPFPSIYDAVHEYTEEYTVFGCSGSTELKTPKRFADPKLFIRWTKKKQKSHFFYVLNNLEIYSTK